MKAKKTTNKEDWEVVRSAIIIERIPSVMELNSDKYVSLLIDLYNQGYIISTVKRMLATGVLSIEQISEMVRITPQSILKIKDLMNEPVV
jgi:hypothetical protein